MAQIRLERFATAETSVRARARQLADVSDRARADDCP
jgi:hypothetical protein